MIAIKEQRRNLENRIWKFWVVKAGVRPLSNIRFFCLNRWFIWL